MFPFLRWYFGFGADYAWITYELGFFLIVLSIGRNFPPKKDLTNDETVQSPWDSVQLQTIRALFIG